MPNTVLEDVTDSKTGLRRISYVDGQVIDMDSTGRVVRHSGMPNSAYNLTGQSVTADGSMVRSASSDNLFGGVGQQFGGTEPFSFTPFSSSVPGDNPNPPQAASPGAVAAAAGLPPSRSEDLKEMESYVEYLREALKEASGWKEKELAATLERAEKEYANRTEVANIGAGASRYGSELSLEGTKYASDNSLEGTKYASDNSLAGTKYSADQSLAGTKYASDNSLAGTKYASDNSLTGTKYSADRGLEGTQYSADAGERNSARSLAGSVYGSDASLAGQKYGVDADLYKFDASQPLERADRALKFLDTYTQLSQRPDDYLQSSNYARVGRQVEGMPVMVSELLGQINPTAQSRAGTADMPQNAARAMFGDDPLSLVDERSAAPQRPVMTTPQLGQVPAWPGQQGWPGPATAQPAPVQPTPVQPTPVQPGPGTPPVVNPPGYNPGDGSGSGNPGPITMPPGAEQVMRENPTFTAAQAVARMRDMDPVTHAALMQREQWFKAQPADAQQAWLQSQPGYGSGPQAAPGGQPTQLPGGTGRATDATAAVMRPPVQSPQQAYDAYKSGWQFHGGQQIPEGVSFHGGQPEILGYHGGQPVYKMLPGFRQEGIDAGQYAAQGGVLPTVAARPAQYTTQAAPAPVAAPVSAPAARPGGFLDTSSSVGEVASNRYSAAQGLTANQTSAAGSGFLSAPPVPGQGQVRTAGATTKPRGVNADFAPPNAAGQEALRQAGKTLLQKGAHTLGNQQKERMSGTDIGLTNSALKDAGGVPDDYWQTYERTRISADNSGSLRAA